MNPFSNLLKYFWKKKAENIRDWFYLKCEMCATWATQIWQIWVLKYLIQTLFTTQGEAMKIMSVGTYGTQGDWSSSKHFDSAYTVTEKGGSSSIASIRPNIPEAWGTRSRRKKWTSISWLMLLKFYWSILSCVFYNFLIVQKLRDMSPKIGRRGWDKFR